MARLDDLKNLIYNYHRRLQKLKEQKALAGRSVDPAILIEIEDIEVEIRDLETERAVIETRIRSTLQADPPPFSRIAPELPRARVPSILVVDDEPDVLDHLCLTLEMAGYQTLRARDGSEALYMLQDQPIDLILSDISMPSMSGYQLYDRLCENAQWVDIPFIFLTARTLDSDINYGKELGADDYLTKPIRPEHLLSVVRGKLRRQMAINRLRLSTIA